MDLTDSHKLLCYSEECVRLATINRHCGPGKMSMKRIGVSNSCSCVKVDLSSGNEFYAVDIFPEDEVKALMAYFISESQTVGSQSNREFLPMIFLFDIIR